MRMDAGLDTGPIVAQERTPMEEGETAPELEHRLAHLAAGMLTRDLEAWLAGDISATPQPEAGVSLTRPLQREDGRLDPAKTSAELERQIRAHQPWPGTFLEANSLRLVVWRAHPIDEQRPGLEVGALFRTSEGDLALRAADGALILDEVQPAGGKRMSGAELLRGRPGFANQEMDK